MAADTAADTAATIAGLAMAGWSGCIAYLIARRFAGGAPGERRSPTMLTGRQAGH